MSRKWKIATTGLVVVLLAVTGWVVFSPSTAAIVMIRSVAADGSVEWVDAEIVKAESNNTMVQALPGAGHRHVSRLADDVTIHTVQGCGATPGHGISFFGFGTIECTRDEFLRMPYPPYAPKLWFNGDGEIVEVAGRYHP